MRKPKPTGERSDLQRIIRSHSDQFIPITFSSRIFNEEAVQKLEEGLEAALDLEIEHFTSRPDAV